MLGRCLRLLRFEEKLNPHSTKFRARLMHQRTASGKERMSEQAQLADVGKSNTLGRTRKQRSREWQLRQGSSIAAQAASMSDADWEAVSMEDKQAFTQYIGKVIRERPSMVSEQQRRRYFETTMFDPRDMDLSQTVKDSYERIKMGLPIQVKEHERQQQLGVSEAMYDLGEATIFDPDEAYNLENAMSHTKQLFSDYVEKKKAGLSTEAERRKLANTTAALNYETQKHLANMFHYAEERLCQMAKEENRRRMLHVQAVEEMIKRRKNAKSKSISKLHEESESNTPKSDELAAGDAASLPSAPIMTKKQRLRHILRSTFSLDPNVAHTIIVEMTAQEKFLQFCEVLCRMTCGSGFQHTNRDEGLESYTATIAKLYSVDKDQLATLDAVKYMASLGKIAPVEWAKRWYEKALLVPLQQTPEYQTLQKIQAEEIKRVGAALSASDANSSVVAPMQDAASSSSLVVVNPAEVRTREVVNLVEKMFVPGNADQLKTLHEKRLKYLVYTQMESQIKKARRNAKLFAGVENLPEAEKCRQLYKQLEVRREQLQRSSATGSQEEHDVFNSFEDSEMQRLFGDISTIVRSVIRRITAASAAEKRAAHVKRVVDAVRGGDIVRAVQQAHEEKKQQVQERMLRILEKDVREDMAWLEQFEEAERPPLLPIPEPMSYVSAADVAAWKELRAEHAKNAGNPFKSAAASKTTFQPSLLGQPWSIPDKPMLFWGTGAKAVAQALQQAAEDAERRRNGEPPVPPYPCAENPWGWRVADDILESSERRT
jgi:hypothetical protein